MTKEDIEKCSALSIIFHEVYKGFYPNFNNLGMDNIFHKLDTLALPIAHLIAHELKDEIHSDVDAPRLYVKTLMSKLEAEVMTEIELNKSLNKHDPKTETQRV